MKGSEGSMSLPNKIPEMRMARIIPKIDMAALHCPLTLYKTLLLVIVLVSSQKNIFEVLCYIVKSINGVNLFI